MLLNSIITLIACCASARLYRAGGQGKPYNTKYRDLGCPLVFLVAVFALYNKFSLFPYLITFGLSFSALTTYWDFLFGEDNFYAHGFFCGVAGLPLLWAGVPLWAIIARIVIITVGMGLWSKWVSDDTLEELGRGFLYIL